MEAEFMILKLEDIKKKVHQATVLTNDLMAQSELASVIEEIDGTIKALRGE